VIAFRAENGNNGWPRGENNTELPPDLKLIHAAVCAELVSHTVSKLRSNQPCFAQIDEYSGPFQYDTGYACQVYISEKELDLLSLCYFWTDRCYVTAAPARRVCVTNGLVSSLCTMAISSKCVHLDSIVALLDLDLTFVLNTLQCTSQR
jgi:hypothetical protein